MQQAGKPRNQSSRDQQELKDLWQKVNQVEGQIKNLDSKTSILPRVDEDGGSECPFAEDLYAQKEEAERELTKGIQKLEGFLPVLDREIARCRNNMNRIKADASSLNRQEAKNGYSQAEKQQRYQYQKNVEDRKKVLFVLKKANLALEIAQSKKFPGRKPQRSSPFGKGPTTMEPSPPRSTKPPPYAPPVRSPGGTFPLGPIVSNPGPQLGGEVGGILSTGPLK